MRRQILKSIGTVRILRNQKRQSNDHLIVNVGSQFLLRARSLFNGVDIQPHSRRTADSIENSQFSRVSCKPQCVTGRAGILATYGGNPRATATARTQQ